MKDWIKIIIMVLIVIFILFLGYFLFTKFTGKNNSNQKEKTTINEIKDVYELGDEIIFTELEDVMFKNADDKRDFSKWRVLSQEKNYLVLYSVVDWGEIDVKMYYNELMQQRKIMTQYKLFTGYDEDFRLLGNKELELFGCNTYNMTCLNVPEWIGSTFTSINSNKGDHIVFNDNIMNTDNINDKIIYHPVIRISKDKIK